MATVVPWRWSRDLGGGRQSRVENARQGLGEVLMAQGNYGEPLAEFERALEMREGSRPEEHPELAMTRASVGRALLALGRERDAVTFLERAYTQRSASKEAIAPQILGETCLALAEALLRQDPGSARGQELAAQAAEAYGASSQSYEPERRRADTLRDAAALARG